MVRTEPEPGMEGQGEAVVRVGPSPGMPGLGALPKGEVAWRMARGAWHGMARGMACHGMPVRVGVHGSCSRRRGLPGIASVSSRAMAGPMWHGPCRADRCFGMGPHRRLPSQPPPPSLRPALAGSATGSGRGYDRGTVG